MVFFNSSEMEFHILRPIKEKVSIPVFTLLNFRHGHDHTVSKSYEDRLSDNFPMEINRRNLVRILSFWSIFFWFLTLDDQKHV